MKLFTADGLFCWWTSPLFCAKVDIPLIIMQGGDNDESAGPKEFLGLTEAECVRVQEELSPALEPWDRTPPGDIRSVAGVDLAYWQEGGRELAVCCIVVLDAWTGAVLEEAHCAGEVRFPYIPAVLRSGSCLWCWKRPPG